MLGSIVWLGVFLCLGHLIKRIFFQSAIMPAALLGGFLALLIGPQVLGSFLPNSNLTLNSEHLAFWRDLPSELIVIVFACIFLGKAMPSLRTVWHQSLPNLCFGYTLALGQYLVGLTAGVVILASVFDLSPLLGALIAIGFQGGHGTVAGLQDTFTQLDISHAYEIGLGVATLGLLGAIVMGTFLSNLHKPSAINQQTDKSSSEPEHAAPFSMHCGLVVFVCALAWLLLNALVSLEQNTSIKIFSYMPLFPVAMLVGMSVQFVCDKTGWNSVLNRADFNRISNFALDLLIISALGSLDLSVLSNYWHVITILGSAGLLYCGLIYYCFAAWFFTDNWRIRGLGELGQSMGTTAIGLLILRQTAPNTSKIEAPFSYKQPLYEPIVGGGLVTALALPMLVNWGVAWFVAGITACMAVMILTFACYKKTSRDDRQ
mgnify:CR=1 FL=1